MKRRAERRYPPVGVTTWAHFREVEWANRRCFICREYGECAHREPHAVSVREFWWIRRANLQGRTNRKLREAA